MGKKKKKYSEGQDQLHCVFVNLGEKNLFQEVELQFRMKRSEVAEKYVRAVWNIYEDGKTEVRSADQVADGSR